jgi:TetR/AcrR family transcriptional repressor of nem operon
MPRASAREKLLDAGTALLHRQGFASTGVQQITDTAGVPKGSFYNHFPSKQAFGLAALEVYRARFAPAFAALESADPPRDRVRTHFQQVQALMTELGAENGCMLGNLAIEAVTISDQVRARAEALFRDWSASLSAVIQAGIDDGSLRPAVPAGQLADFLIAAWQGVVQRMKTNGHTGPMDGFFANLDRLLG